MKWRWYFIFPIVVFGLFLAFAITTTVQIFGTDIEWNNQGFENFFDSYSASVKVLSAAVITFTITFTIYRIDQTQKSLDNQDRQIKMALSKEILDDYNKRLTIHDDNPKLFRAIKFSFRDNYQRILPNAKCGDSRFNDSLENWMSSLQDCYNKVDLGIDDNDINRYLLNSYSKVCGEILSNFESTFLTHYHSIDSNYFIDNSNKLLVDANGQLLYNTLIEIWSVANYVNEYSGLKFYGFKEINEFRNKIGYLNMSHNLTQTTRQYFEGIVNDLRSYGDQKSLDRFNTTKTHNSLISQPPPKRSILAFLIFNNKDIIPMANAIIEMLDVQININPS